MNKIITTIVFKIFVIFLYNFLCFFTFLGCSKDKNDFRIKGEYSKHFLKIENLRKDKPIDFAKINSIYSYNLSNFIQSVDSESHTIIQEAIQAGKMGENNHIQSQIISKTIQKVFFKHLTKSLEFVVELKDNQSYKNAIANIEESYKILRPTVIRRSKWIGRGSELDDICLNQIKLMKIGADETNRDLDKAKNNLIKFLTYTYILSIFYEFDGIEQNRGKDHKKCEEKVVEARIFFDIVSEKAVNITLKGLSKTALSFKYTDMDIDNMRRLISKTFNTKIPKIP